MKEDLIESFSGVRGIWRKGLSEELVLKYGLSFVWLLKKQLQRKPCLVIGYDSRPSSKKIAQIFKNAFLPSARKIIDVGVSPLPAVELAVRSYGADGGVMITASHCPKEYNGWKLLDKTGAIISPGFLAKVIRQKNKITQPKYTKSRGRISIKDQDLKKKYLTFVKKIIGQSNLAKIKQRHFKIVVDPNGGTAATLIKPLLESMQVKGIYLNMKLGRFAREIEPNIRSLAYLRKIIRKEKADFGVGFDCDADRVELVLGDKNEFVRKHGPIVNGQYILALLVDEILSKLKNPETQVVITNDCTSNLVRKVAEKYGAQVKEVEVGEINVVNKMLKEKSPIGGEGSNGGVIFPPSRCRDGLLTLAMLLRCLSSREKTLPEILSEYPDYFMVQEKLDFPAAKHIEVREKIKNILQKQGIKIQERGGKTGTVKALIDNNSFIFFRASKTEPGVFRVIADATDLKTAQDLLKKGVEIFKKALE